MGNRRLLFVGAHPDDETFGVGGTLARYALEGVSVYYACATRGEAGSVDAELMKGYGEVSELRWAELECAGRILGLEGIQYLGYRDSGMLGSEDNRHPMALAAAPVEEVAGKIVKVIREVQPQVVVTFDPIGGYRHPDHIAVHNAAILAFPAAGDACMFPEAGAPYGPQKLYYHVMSRRILKLAMKILPLLGQDPAHFGRNRDIDLTPLAAVDFPVHARIKLTADARDRQRRARACHHSQVSGGPPRVSLMGLVARLDGQADCYMRAFPAAGGKVSEKDLFEAVNTDI